MQIYVHYIYYSEPQTDAVGLGHMNLVNHMMLPSFATTSRWPCAASKPCQMPVRISSGRMFGRSNSTGCSGGQHSGLGSDMVPHRKHRAKPSGWGLSASHEQQVWCLCPRTQNPLLLSSFVVGIPKFF